MFLERNDRIMKPTRNLLDVQAATVVAKKYCTANNLSVLKLSLQKTIEIQGEVIFAQPSDYSGTLAQRAGLLMDKQTQPKPTLVVRKTGNGYEVEETEYTRKYLV